MVFPYQHRIRFLISKNIALDITDFHRRWLLHQLTPLPSHLQTERSIKDIFSSIVLECEQMNPHQQACREAEIQATLEELESATGV